MKNKKLKNVWKDAYTLAMVSARDDLIPFRNLKDWTTIWDDIAAAKGSEATAWDLWNSFENSWHTLGPVDRFNFFKGMYPLIAKEFELPRMY
jgi:hypothetical protein